MRTDWEVLTKEHESWEKCARHYARYTARNVSYFFLCDSCTVLLVSNALNNRPALYHGDRMQGFCGLCNELTDVALRQWFMCLPCYNVVAAYQKGFTSAKAVHAFWRSSIAPLAPSLSLAETDVVTLSPYVRGGKTKRQAAELLDTADFLVSEKVDGNVAPKFHIELKAGPGAVDDMSAFQLDVNDYNDIVGPVLLTGLPAYVFHVQIGMEYFPPTRRAVARNMWWTDMISLRSSLTKRAQRRDEVKAALYFDPKCFRPISDFPNQVTTRAYEQMAEELRRVPLAME